MYDYLVGRVLIVEADTSHGLTVISGTVTKVERENDGFATIELHDAVDDEMYQFVLQPGEPITQEQPDTTRPVGRLTDFVVTAANPSNRK